METTSSPSSPPPPKKLKMSSTTTTSDDNDDRDASNPSSSAAADPAKPRRFKRRKVAIFLAYCGAGYQGMQKNPGAKTIEGDLEDALFLAGGVPEPDRHCPKRFDWARAARTDKGVSAAAQVVSGRFYIDPPGFIERLNSHLPPQIRIFGFKRVTASFNAKKFCDRRRYVYLLPVFALDPSSHPDRESVLASVGSDSELEKCFECSERGRKVAGLMGRRGGKEESGAGADNGRCMISATTEEVEKTELGNTGLSNGESEENEKTDAVGIDFVENIEKSEDQQTLTTEQNGEGRSQETANVEEAQECETEIIKNEESEEARTGLAEVSEETKSRSIGLGNVDEQVAAKSSVFCYGEKEKERFHQILQHYVGTHNFHNFTTRTKAEDPSARRYIVSFSADRIVTVDGIDFVRCEVVGQSFMLHQIRKMIGMAVAVMRNGAPESLIPTALQKDVHINVPTAPEVGLYLDECLFASYNQKWKDSHEELSMAAYMEEADEFRMKYIYSHVASMEQKEGVVGLWLHSLNHRNYPDLHWSKDSGVSAKMEYNQDVNMAE
ncbi:hypothetical protein ACLOJK_018177 [Asimina triloba]